MAACNHQGFIDLLGEIKIENLNELDKKMIEYLENLDYNEPITKNFGNMIIGRIIKENNLKVDNIPLIASLKECGVDVVNCDNLLFQFVKTFKDITTAYQDLFKEAYNLYPNLSYHAKMRLQFIIYRLIYTSNIAQYNTEDNRKEFVKFFDNRCLNAQYRNILYQDEKKILNDIDTVRQADFDVFKEKLTKSIFNISNVPTTFKSFKTDGITELTITDFASFDTGHNKDDLKTLFEEKMKIMGGYNNKQGNLTYHLCSSDVNISLKKVQAKTAREGAKIMARKLLNKSGNKLVKFSLKRMIGKKEKYYNYQASIDKSGKISIKST